MKKITASILTTLLMLSMVFSSSVFAANEEVSAWDSFLGLFSGNATTTATDAVGVEYRGHIQNVGNFPLDGTWIQGPNQLGTVGQSLRLEGFWIRLSNQPENVNIQYRVHVQNEGWMTPVENGAFAGTEGKSQQIEAIEINLVDDEGNAVQGYSVQYKGHIQNQGDTAWFEDGQQLGTVGSFLRLEALEVKIVTEKADMTAYNAAVAEATALTEADYTAASWAALETALIDNLVTEDNTQAEVDAATAAINAAIDALVEVLKVESVSAINGNEAEVIFNAAIEAAVPANFSVEDEDGNLVFISNVALNEAKNTATLTFFDSFVDGTTYAVTTKNVVDANGDTMAQSVNEFTYEYADPATVVFTGTSILPGGDVKDLVKVTDTLGRDITNESDVEWETSNTAAVSTAGIAGANGTSSIVVAKVLREDDTYVKSAKTTITVSDAVETTFVGYYIYDTDENPAADTDAFNELAADEKVTYVNMGATDRAVALYYTDQFGDSMDVVTTGLTVTNKNPGVVILEADGEVVPMSVGTGYAKVTVEEVEKTIAIEVKAAAEITSMKIDPTSVSVGDLAVAPLNAQTVEITYVDQFGADVTTIPATGALTAESADETIATVTADGVNKDNVTVTGLVEGTTTVTITYTDTTNDIELTKTFGVTVSETGTLAGYVVENADANLNLEQPNEDETPDSSLVEVFAVDANGNKIAQLDPGTDPGDFSLVAVDADGEADDTIIEINADGENVDAVDVGKGYVQVYAGTLLVDTLEFNVVDTAIAADSVVFNNFAAVFGEVESGDTGIDDAAIQTKLNELVTIKDQNGAVIDPVVALFTYTGTNFVGIADDYSTLSAKNATASLVITSVTVAGGDNLITTPVVIQLSARDTIAPTLVVGVDTKALSATSAQLAFSEDIVVTTPAAGRFAINVANVADSAVPTVLNNVVTLTFPAATIADNTATVVDYTALAAGNAANLKDAAGNEVVAFTNQAVAATDF